MIERLAIFHAAVYCNHGADRAIAVDLGVKVMDRFLEAAQIILGHEGGLVDDPLDRGGRTNLGITQGTLNTARRTIPGLPERVDDLTRAQALSIYKALYWSKAKCDDLPEPVDFLMFDAAINCGVGGAALQLQKALMRLGANIRADGAIGPLTMAAFWSAWDSQKWRVIAALLMQRVRWHNDIIGRDKTQLRFIHGWLNRILENSETAGL